MSTTSALSGSQSQEYGLVLLLEGLDSGFCTHEELAGLTTDETSWFAPMQNQTSVALTASLRFPENITFEVDERDGYLVDSPIEFVIDDLDELLVKTFAAFTGSAEVLKDTIDPNDTDLSGITTLEGNTVYDKWVGNEHISGSTATDPRLKNPCFVNDPTTGAAYQIGKFHPGFDLSEERAKVAVSTLPQSLNGMRWALYKTWRDIAASPSTTGSATWRGPTEMKCVGFGTVTHAGGTVGREWKIACRGPASLLQKNLNVDTPTAPFTVYGKTRLRTEDGDREDLVGIRLWSKDLRNVEPAYDDGKDEDSKLYAKFGGGTHVVSSSHYGEDKFENSIYTEGDDADAIAQNLRELVEATVLDNENDGVFQGAHGSGEFKFRFVSTERRFEILSTVLEESANIDEAAVAGCDISMHWKVWALLGFSVIDQGNMGSDHEKFFPFIQKGGIHTFIYDDHWLDGNNDVVDYPGPKKNFITARITTEAPGLDPRMIFNQYAYGPEEDDLGAYVNFEGTRKYRAFSKDGLYFWDHTLEKGNGQILAVVDKPKLFLQGSKFRPPASNPSDNTKAYSIPNGVGLVNRTRLGVLVGTKSTQAVDENGETKTEKKKHYQVARLSWREGTDEAVATDDDGNPAFAITEWLSPRSFGLPNTKIDAPWMNLLPFEGIDEESTVKLYPLAAYKHRPSTNDEAYLIAQRLLLNTGDGTGWTGWEGGTATIDKGENEPSKTHIVGLDTEIADFGCGIPNRFVATISDWYAEHEKLSNHLTKLNLYHHGSMNAEKLLRSIFEPRGWSMGLHDLKFRPFVMWEAVHPTDDNVVTITQEDILGDPQNPEDNWPEVSFGELAPIDHFDVQYFYNPITKATTKNLKFDSTDPGARTRTTDVTKTMKAWGLPNNPFTFHAVKKVWQAGARHWSRKHHYVTFLVGGILGERIFPGTPLILTDTRIANQQGTYGITSFGARCLSISKNYSTDEHEVKAVLYAQNANTNTKLYAGMAVGLGYDPDNKRIYVETNFFNINKWDANSFKKPSYLTTYSGNPNISIYAWDSVSWALQEHAVVTSVNVETGNSYLVVEDALTSWKRDQDHIIVLREIENQNCDWCNLLYAPICSSSGTFGDGEIGYPWTENL